MPPKKRNRDGEDPDPDPDQLDNAAEEEEEVEEEEEPVQIKQEDQDEHHHKEELRAGVDREAELTAQLDQQKAELDSKLEEQRKEFEGKLKKQKAKIAAQKKEMEKLFMRRIFLQFSSQEEGTPNGKIRQVFYPNCRVVQQAEVAEITYLLDYDDAVANPGMIFTDSYVYHYPVETCTELVDIFENGLKAGAVLKEEQQHKSSLFSLIIVTDQGNGTTIPAGEENQYLVIAARSDADRYNPLLAAHLDTNTYQPGVRVQYDVLLVGDSLNKYEADIQDRVRALHDKDYDTVLKGLWVADGPDPDGKVRAHLADIDLNRMVEIAAGEGTETEIGFWTDTAEDGEDDEE